MRDDGKLVGIVSMDLSKAFDVIQRPLLLAKAYGFIVVAEHEFSNIEGIDLEDI